MAQNHVQKGASMPWTNGTGSDVASGDPVEVNDMIGIAAGDIPDGTDGILFLDEVWTLPKEAPLVIDQGDQVYFDSAAGDINKTNTNTPAGKAFIGAASTDTTIQVKINA